MSTSCARFADAVLEHALGEPATEELQAHLPECDDCRAALARERTLLAKLDGGLREALSVSPTPALLPRVRARTAAGKERHAALPWRWLVPLGALAATIAIVAWLRPVSAPAGQAARMEPRREAPDLPPAAVAEAPVARTPNASTKPVRTPRAPLSERLEVLVPQDEEELLRRYAVAVRARRIEAPPFAEAEGSQEVAIPLLRQIAPLDVAPLTDVNPEGVDHE